MTELRQKTIWVTGASSGIGKSVALKLAEGGNRVLVSSRTEEKLLALKALYPDNIVPFVCDVTDAESLTALGGLTEHLDLVVACAGTCEYDDDPSFDEAMYRRVFDANFFGSVNTIRESLPLLKKSALGARFAFVGSLSSIAAFPRAEAYGASKAAVDYLAKTCMVDLKRHKVAVSLIRPGFVDTPLTQKNDFDMPFIISPDDAAKRLIEGLEKGKAVINFPRRLTFTIKLLNLSNRIWRNFIAPKLIKR